MDGTAVQQIADLAVAGAKPVKIGDASFSPVPLHLVRKPADPQPAPLVVHTLTGLVDYLTLNPDALELEKVVLHVVGPDQVDVRSPLFGEHQQRNLYAQAKAGNRLAGFQLEQFIAAEDMIIGLQARFADAGDRADVLRLLGNLKDEAVRTQADDGVSQVATIRSGVSMVAEAPVPNPVQLAPFRTFPEVDQPVAPFVLRLKKGGHDGIRAALFEADGGAWKGKAIGEIADYLGNEISGVKILA